MASAAKRVARRAGALEQSLDELDVHVASIVRRARDGELPIAESECVESARRDEWKGLERFGRRAERKALVRIAERVRELAAFVHDGDGRRVHGVDDRPAVDARSDGIP